MNKKQMAEWLAKNVLDCTYCKDCDVWVSDTVKDDIVEFIYSPDGFFAVWDAVDKERWTDVVIFKSPSDYHCDITFNAVGKSEGYGKDRYEAFYNAVYEARNEKISTNS